jgi:hypothetical protein
VAVAGGGSEGRVMPFNSMPQRKVSTDQIRELDIPTFIRRQMD